MSPYPTIVRMVGTLIYSFDRAQHITTEVGQLHIAIYCVEAALPAENPATTGNDLWMWTGYLRSAANAQDIPHWNGTSVVTQGATLKADGNAARVDFDARSMRKVAENCELRIGLIAANVAGTPSVHRLNGYVRCLIKE